MATRAGILGDVPIRNRRIGVSMRLDRMDSVAVGANRGQTISPANSLPVDALHEGLRDLRMALATGLRDIELVYRRLLIVGRKDLMRAVAVCADRSLFGALLDGEPMHALLIRDERLVALPVRFHQELLSVAPAARRGDVVVIYRRLGVIGG